MGGRAGEDIRHATLGFLDAGANHAITNMLQKQTAERNAMTQLAAGLAQSGQLNQLPDDMRKAFEKTLGKNLTGALQFQSNIRSQELAPQREAQRDIHTVINRPTQEVVQEARPAAPVEELVQQAQPQAAPTQLSQAVQAEPMPQDMTTRVPAAEEVIEFREPTAEERMLRRRQLTPTEVGLLVGDVQFGQLQLGTFQQQNEQVKNALRKRELALDERRSAFGKPIKMIGVDGTTQWAMPQYNADGSVSTIKIGRAEASDGIVDAWQRVSQIEETLANPDISDAARRRAENNLFKAKQGLVKRLERSRGINIDNREGFSLPMPNGEVMSVPAGTDPKVVRNLLQETYRLSLAAEAGNKDELIRARDIVRNGKLLFRQMGRIRDLAQPQFFGMAGKLTGYTEKALSSLQGGREFVGALKTFLAGGRFEFRPDVQFLSKGHAQAIKEGREPTAAEKAASRTFRNRLQSRVTGAGDRFQRALNLLVIQRLKLVDPSVVREGEFDRELKSLSGDSFQGFLAALEEVEIDVRNRVDIAEQELEAARQRGLRAADPNAEITQHSPVTQAGERPQSEVLAERAVNEKAQNAIIDAGAVATQMGIKLQDLDPNRRAQIATAISQLIRSNPDLTRGQIREAIPQILQNPEQAVQATQQAMRVKEQQQQAQRQQAPAQGQADLVNRIAQAETQALRSLNIDPAQLPQAVRNNMAAQLRNYLQIVPNPTDQQLSLAITGILQGQGPPSAAVGGQ